MVAWWWLIVAFLAGVASIGLPIIGQILEFRSFLKAVEEYADIEKPKVVNIFDKNESTED